MRCHTVRYAVKMSNDGDRIYIDYAQGKPYMECENITAPIAISKSISFFGFKGKAEIRCKQSPIFFRINSSGLFLTRVEFFDIIISDSQVVAELDVGAKTKLVFQNSVVRNNNQGIHSRNSGECTIQIFNSSFVHNFVAGIHLRCFNVTARIVSTTFKLSYVYLTNILGKPAVLRNSKLELLVLRTVFDRNSRICSDIFQVKPFAAVVNITIIDSAFRNLYELKCSKGKLSALHIVDYHSVPRKITVILMKDLLVENNYSKQAAVVLLAGYAKRTITEINIRDCVYRNNSVALSVGSHPFSYSASAPTVYIANNTFIENFYNFIKPNAGAAILIRFGKTQVISSRFLNNRAGPNSYTAVATVSNKATVSFVDCYFENQQTKVESNQFFTSDSRSIRFTGTNTFNIIALKEKQSVFTYIPTNLGSVVIMNKNFKILCPQGYKLNPLKRCYYNPRHTIILCYYVNVQCEQCPSKTYTVERGTYLFNQTSAIDCRQCPRGGDCVNGLVTAKPNFWGYQVNKEVVFLQCPPGYCCDSEDCVTYNSCHGNRTGTLCGQCPEGMSESLFSTQCISNIECFLNYFVAVGGIAVLLLYLIFFLYQKEILKFVRNTLFSKRLQFFTNRNGLRNDSSTDGNSTSFNGLLKIFFYYYQVFNLLKSSVGVPKEGSFINSFENVISRMMNMVVANFPFFNCPFKDLYAVPKQVILHSVGYCLLALLGLLYCMSKCFPMFKRARNTSDRRTPLENITIRSVRRNSDTKSSFSQRVVSAFTHISLLMYASSTQLCLSLLHCVPVGDKQVLFLYGYMKCYQTFQYFLLAYMISSIIPFCLVPVLGSYLLKCGRIGVKQFCAACIFPLPFCGFWLYLLFKACRNENQETYHSMEDDSDTIRSQQSNNEAQILSSEDSASSCTNSVQTLPGKSETAILKVLLGPFRPHQSFMCFPPSSIPWEGFLIFRRLVLIIVLTFVYDIQLKLFLALTLCVAILFLHMVVNPFQRKLDNLLESFSLSVHVVVCGLTLMKTLYYGEDYSVSKRFPVLHAVENILILAPVSIIVIFIVLSVALKLVLSVRRCITVIVGKIIRLL